MNGRWVAQYAQCGIISSLNRVGIVYIVSSMQSEIALDTSEAVKALSIKKDLTS